MKQLKKQLLLFSLILLVFGCQPKEDESPEVVNSPSISEQFYDYKGDDPLIQEMVRVLKGRENADKIAQVLHDHFGKAHWDIAAKGPSWLIDPNGKRGVRSGNSEEEGEEEFYPDVLVPLALDDEERVTGIIGWRRLSDGTDVIRYFERNVYANLSKDQKMEQEPRLIAGRLLEFENTLFGKTSLWLNDIEYRLEEGNQYTNPADFGWSCKKASAYDRDGRLIASWYYDCEDYTVVVGPDYPAFEEPKVNTEPIWSEYYDHLYQFNTYYLYGGAGSYTNYHSNEPDLIDDGPTLGGNIPTISAHEGIVAGPGSFTNGNVERWMYLIAGELVKHEDTEEVAYALYEAADDDNLDVTEKFNLGMRAKIIYDAVYPNNFNIDGMSSPVHTRLAKEAAFIDLYPEMKRQVQDNGWPLSPEEWGALWEIFKPMLAEVFLEALPGGGLTLAFRDILQGTNSRNISVITAGLVGLILEFYPPGKIFKAARRAGRVVRTGFKVFKHAFKHLATIAQALKKGLKLRVDGSVVKLMRGTDEVARISRNVLEFNYTGFGGKITTNPNKTTTVIGKLTDNVNGGGTSEIIESGLSKSGKNDGGLNALNADPSGNLSKDELWRQINEPWLREATLRGDVIRVVSDPQKIENVFTVTDDIPISVFSSPSRLFDFLKNLDDTRLVGNMSLYGRELRHLAKNGYSFDPITNTLKK